MALQTSANKNQDFEIYAGEDKVLSCTVVDEAGDPYDLTSHTITWGCSFQPDLGSQINKITGGGITITSAADGEFDISLDAGDTDDPFWVINSNAAVITLYHYCKITAPGGEKSVIFEGKMFVLNNTEKHL